MKALIIGGTGATGKDLVNTILLDKHYSEVVSFVRRPSGLTHPSLKEVVTDFENLEKMKESINGDVLFSCLGTTRKTAGSKKKQSQIDYELPLSFAQMARTKGVGRIVLLSAYGASPSSRLFYSALKGKLEDAIENLGYEQFIIFRPGLLLRKNSDRTGEKISAIILHFLNRMGLLERFRPMPTEVLALKMAKAPISFPLGKHVIELDKIFDL